MAATLTSIATGASWSEHDLAAHVAGSTFEGLPLAVADHVLRTFVNFSGCAIGGSHHEAVLKAEQAFAAEAGHGSSHVFGRSVSYPMPLAALLNGMAGAVNAFDDTHAEAIIHPGSPVGAALVALASAAGEPIDGPNFLTAYAWGVELACRLSKAASVAPAEADMGWSQTGAAGPVGAAAACARLMRLGEEETLSAIGTAAATAAGLRVAHGTMAMHLLPARAAQIGLEAALLAKAGFTGPRQALTGKYGHLELFSRRSAPAHLFEGLGERFELLANMFKPYPCGIVIHAVIDACLALHRSIYLTVDQIEELVLQVPPATVALTNLPHPSGMLAAQISVQHWAAAALLRGRAGLAEGAMEEITAEDITAVRSRCRLVARFDFAADAAAATLRLRDGRVQEISIRHCSGSLTQPLDRDAISEKFLGQAAPLLGGAAARRLLGRYWSLADADDVRPLWADVDDDVSLGAGRLQ